MGVESRFRRLQALFDDAIDLPPHEREAFVERCCADDDALGDELRRLLARELDQRLIDDAGARDALDRTLRDVLPDAFVEGRQLGPFRVIEQLGGGGMGRVFRAIRTDGAVEQEVAVKLVRADIVNRALFKRFSIERRLLAALDHPNICRFIDAGELPDGTPYAVMEFVRGRPLFEYCDAHRLTIEQRIALLRKIAAAVSHAHANLIIHRDIKSDNILVTDDGEPKLLDFGIAKTLEADGGQTQTADRFLTPANAAPEQLRGHPCGVGCDVYAIGLLAYQLLCGSPAFDASRLTAGELERQILLVPPALMSQRVRRKGLRAAHERRLSDSGMLARRLTGDLDIIVATCIRKSASERYTSVQHLDDDLFRVLDRLPISSRSGDTRYRARKFIARHRLAVALGAGLLATLLASTAFISVQAWNLATQRNVAIRERDRAEQVAILLHDAFVSADPAGISGANVTARQILDAALPRIDALFESRPDVFAALAATVSEVQLGLTMHSDALTLAARGERALTNVPAEPALLRRLLAVQARASISLTKLDDAARHLEAMRAGDSEESLDWMIIRGTLLDQQRREPEAAEVLERAVRRSAHASAEDETATRARWELARVLGYLERHEEARRLLERTLEWQSESLPSDHPRLTLTRLRLVDALRAGGHAGEAVALANDVVRHVGEAYGDHSAWMVRATLSLAMAAERAKIHQLAIESYQRAIAAGSEALGADDPLVVTTQFNLAISHHKGGETERAAASYRAAAERAATAFGPGANRTFYMRMAWAGIELARGRPETAMEILVSEQTTVGLDQADRENTAEFRSLLVRAAANVCPEGRKAGPCGRAGLLLAEQARTRPPTDRLDR